MQSNDRLNPNMVSQIMDACRSVAGKSEIVSAALSYASLSDLSKKMMLEVVVVARDFKPRLRSILKSFGKKSLLILAVDQWVFERDVERGLLGEASANMLVFPFVTLYGYNYLHKQEMSLKRRLILELLENFVLNFPDLFYVAQIEPKYFMYEIMLSRIRSFPPLSFSMAGFLSNSANPEKIDPVLEGYIEVLNQLSLDNKIRFSNGKVTIQKGFAANCKSSKTRLINISKNGPRALFSSFFGVFPQLINFLTINNEISLKLQRFNVKFIAEPLPQFVNPQGFVHVPTTEGLVSLADRVDIEAFIRKMKLDGTNSSVSIQSIGGILNDLFLIKASRQGKENKILVKRFKDWSGFKWLPLTMWSVGVTNFVVVARSRLERECAINEILSKEGFRVPKIFHISHNQRLVFMEFIEGEDLSIAIRRIATSRASETENDIVNVRRVGEVYAKVHATGVTLGDTKPENVIVTGSNEICLLDFEQATRGGDKAWDVTEFLYFSGHYLSPGGVRKAKSVASAFKEGYLNAGGSREVMMKAGTYKYTRVFSIFTLPSIIRAIADVCQEVSGKEAA
jgi:tRNA A-37 threonylcarbamoyl transferase component Bud32